MEDAGPQHGSWFSRVRTALGDRVSGLRAVRAFRRYAQHQGPVLADGVTYRALFSVFAALLLGFSAAALWLAGNPVAWQAVVDAVDAAVPGLLDVVDLDAIRTPTGLTLAGAVSLVGLIGAALGAIRSLRTALRTIAGTVHDDIAWYLVILRDLAVALGIAVAFLAAAALTFAGRWLVGLLAAASGADEDSAAVLWSVRIVSLLVVLLLDAALVAGSFLALSGVRPPLRTLLPGTLLGAVALIVLQELSGLFVGGAAANPLLASFASLLALLIWMNLSTQAILLAAAYIVTAQADAAARAA